MASHKNQPDTEPPKGNHAGHWHQKFHKVAQTTLLSSQTTTPHEPHKHQKTSEASHAGSKKEQYAKQPNNANKTLTGRVGNAREHHKF
jgi:hypothetical protein